MAWCGYNDFVPGRVHVPYWSKKPLPDTECQITPFSVYLGNAMAKLINDNVELHQQLNKQAEESQPMSAAVSSQEGGKGGSNKGQHGGWAMRMAKLLYALFQKDTGTVEELREEFYNSPTMKPLVDKMYWK